MRVGLMDVESAAEMVEKDLSNADIENQPSLLVLAGEYRRLNGDYKNARTHFQLVVTDHPTTPEKNAAALGMAIIDFESGKNQSLDTIRTALEESVPDTLNADRFRVLFLAEMDKNGPLAERYRNKAEIYAKSHTITQSHFDRDIGSSETTSNTANGEQEDTYNEGIETSELERIDNMKLALESKDWGIVIASADTFSKDFPESEYTFLVEAYKDRATAQEPFVNNRIAVFLPLSGRYGPAAQSIQNSIRFALGSDASIDLKFYDTGWEPMTPLVFADPEKPTEEELTAQLKWDEDNATLMETVGQNGKALVKQAVIDDGCALLIGPLLTDIAPGVAEASVAYGIPMLSLANSGSVTDAGPEVHQISIGLQQQIDTLVSHAMDVKGWSTFVAMVPQNELGTEALDVFTQSVKAKGGNVIRHIEYSDKATSFVEEARRLGLKSEIRPTEKQLEKDPTLDHPTIDFDAIFIPDNHRKTPLITSALAAEEFSIGSFRINRHAKPVGVMGLNKWNHPTVVKNGGQYMQNGIFVDAFWNEATDESTQDFVTRFETEFGRKPNIINAISYDAIQIGKQVFDNTQTSRKSVTSTLHTSQFTNTVTGAKGFGEEQVLQRELKIMMIKRDRLELWTPPTPEE
jgi:ABC-type branched-subunit amino acid transport system substrate-binding protein